MEVRTRFAPSPTGYMHIGNLRTALYEYLIAKSQGGKFILRIEDTDQGRLVEGSLDVIYKTMKMTGLQHDEGPDIGGEYGPYVQSERMGLYMDYAKELVEKGEAYYCFCTKERLESLKEANAEGVSFAKYDRHCLHLSPEEVQAKLAAGEPFVIRQKMPESGTTSFHDMVYGDITVDNAELDDQILMKADGFPTYNFANVVDDHLMHITHVVRGSEYLSSTPKYNLLYQAFGWEPPIYVHLPAVMRDAHHKLSKRHGDKSFEDLVNEGYVVEAIVNYIALLGWSPSDNVEIFTLKELEQKFDMAGLSKSPSIFDIKKLTWMNSEYLKAMDFDKYFELARPKLEEALAGTDLDLKKIAALLQKRLETLNDIPRLVEELEVPCAVKIVNGGSSIGVELPDTKEQLREALAKLLAYGDHVVVEKKIKGREIQIAVLGDTYLPAVEIIPRGEYFDYVSKYQKGGAQEICPAPITEEEWHQIGEMALKLHRGLGLSVYSRSDFLLDEEGKAWCLEINTLPGMTPTSLVPQEAAQVGLSYADLCERIVEESLKARGVQRT